MAWLWFFGIGFAVYLASLPFRKAEKRIRFCVFLGSGLLVSVAAAFLGGPHAAQGFHLPKAVLIAGGVTAGCLLFYSEHRRWFERFWLRYFLTPLVGTGIAFGMALCFVANAAVSRTLADAVRKPAPIMATFLVMGLLTAFGYTFPERWFAKEEKTKTTDAG